LLLAFFLATPFSFSFVGCGGGQALYRHDLVCVGVHVIGVQLQGVLRRGSHFLVFGVSCLCFWNSLWVSLAITADISGSAVLWLWH
jgi:hypothetical protein